MCHLVAHFDRESQGVCTEDNGGLREVDINGSNASDGVRDGSRGIGPHVHNHGLPPLT